MEDLEAETAVPPPPARVTFRISGAMSTQVS